MKAPSNSNKISKAWLEFMLKEYEGKTQPVTSVTVSDFSVNQGIPPGEGFNSELVLVDVTAEVKRQGSDKESEEKTYHFAAKFLHKNPFNAEFIKHVKGHTKEYLMYSTIVNDLNAFQAASAPDDTRIIIPDLIYGKDDGSEYVLVMENLKAAGFATNDKRKGLDFDHVMEAVSQLARLHAVSYAYGQSHDFLKMYPFFSFSETIVYTSKVFLFAGLDSAIKYLRSLKDKDELAQKIENSKTIVADKLVEVMLDKGDMLCLCHGDFWNSNIMYKYSNSTDVNQHKIEGIKMIDWGNCCWGNPLNDLQYLIYTSTTFALRKEHLENILKAYHSLFTSVTAKLGKSLPHFNYEAFKKEWERTAIVGFGLGTILIQGTLSTTNPANKASEPSVLDYAAFAPVRFVVRRLQTGIAKIMAAKIAGPNGVKIIEKFLGNILKPITKELLSGKNEVLSNRLLEHLIDADERGIFDP